MKKKRNFILLRLFFIIETFFLLTQKIGNVKIKKNFKNTFLRISKKNMIIKNITSLFSKFIIRIFQILVLFIYFMCKLNATVIIFLNLIKKTKISTEFYITD